MFEELIESISKNVLREINCNYDYYHLKKALELGKKETVDTLIAGSSYGLLGIDERQLTTAVNLSLPSQDLYYAARGVYEVCAANSKLKNVVLCYGWYSFYSDLSRAQSEDELAKVSNVYYPIYGDMHNCALLPPGRKLLDLSDIFDMENIAQLYFAGEYEKMYFNERRLRKLVAVREWEDKSKDWYELSEEEKHAAAKKRAERHNKSIAHEDSLCENSRIVRQLSEFCQLRGINLILVVAPATKWYRKYLHKGFRDVAVKILNEAEGDIHLLDLFEDSDFADEDFNDMDHLGETGAQKMTEIILDMVHQLNDCCQDITLL